MVKSHLQTDQHILIMADLETIGMCMTHLQYHIQKVLLQEQLHLPINQLILPMVDTLMVTGMFLMDLLPVTPKERPMDQSHQHNKMHIQQMVDTQMDIGTLRMGMIPHIHAVQKWEL